jgi:hypothetical protein
MNRSRKKGKNGGKRPQELPALPLYNLPLRKMMIRRGEAGKEKCIKTKVCLLQKITRCEKAILGVLAASFGSFKLV